MASFVYDKKESKGSGRRQFILSRYGVRFHFGHATSDFNEKMILAFQKKCMQWLDSLSQKDVDFYRNNYYKSTVYIGRARVENDIAKGKLKKPAVKPVAKPVNKDAASKTTKKAAKKAKKTVKKSIKKTSKKTSKKASKKVAKKSASKKTGKKTAKKTSKKAKR